MTDLELRQMLPRSMDEILRLQRHLTSALDRLDELPNPFRDLVESPKAVNEAVEQACCDLAIAYETVGNIRDRLIELIRLVERMVAQRQSTADAFEAGYEARYIDLIAQLSGPEYAALRHALVKLVDGDTIPF